VAWAHVTPEVLISERPAEADDRAIPGHHEVDLIIAGQQIEAAEVSDDLLDERTDLAGSPTSARCALAWPPAARNSSTRALAAASSAR
jgi:hypothetical protein